MHCEWIRSPVFRLSLVTPLMMLIVFAAFIELSPAGPAWFIALVAVSVATAAWVGIRLAAREQRLLGAGEYDTVERQSDASLSTARAATYRDLFENATDIVFTTDLSGHFLAGNKAVQRLLGYTVEEAKSLTWEKLVASYDMWKARQMYKRHAMGEKRISFELDTVTAGGEIKTFEIGSRPMFRGDELCGFHGIARDITSRKEMEKQLESARREAETANRSKSTFLANMSHEIRTPINGILGFLSLFAKTELTPRQKEYLVPVEESARHLLKIINDILDLSKIEAGRFSIDNEIFGFRNVVGGAVELLRPLGENKGLAVHVEVDPRIPELVVGDGTRIGQVVSNLVNNAIKFTDAGSVSVRSRAAQLDASRLSVEISVRDTGIGIAPGHRERLFEPFHQIDARPDRRYAGTGLGLAISRNLVEAMGGGIEVRSEPGRFTEVNFSLPLARAPDGVDGAMDDADASQRFAGKGLSVLVVDDNEINRWYLRAVLEQYGIDVHQAASGGAALESCSDRRFDMVFMDIHMADMDGIETTRRLHAQVPAYRGVPVVAVSADVVGDSALRFTREGLDHFLAKPVKEEALVRLLSATFPERAAGEAAATGGSPDGGGECVLDRARGVALASHDERLWRRSVDALRQQTMVTLPRIRSAREEGDHDEVRRLAHKLAGSAGYVAAQELAGRARDLEYAAQRPGDDTLGARLAELDRAVERFMDVDADAGG